MLLFQASAGAATSALHWVRSVLGLVPKYCRALSTSGSLDFGVPQVAVGAVPTILARIFNSACGLRRMRLVSSRKYCSSLLGSAAWALAPQTSAPRAAKSRLDRIDKSLVRAPETAALASRRSVDYTTDFWPCWDFPKHPAGEQSA